jgi:hypothetical protein
MTLIPDYRRVNATESAHFPSGAQDLGALLTWLDSEYLKEEEEENSSGRREVFLMGNSAGGVHLSTFLLSAEFEGARKRYAGTGGGSRVGVKGAVLFAVPFHFRNAGPERGDVLRAYYGSGPGDVEAKCPYGLLQALEGKGLKAADLGISPVLVLEGELDPENEILEPGRDFVRLWEGVFGGPEGMEEWGLKGHNHISPQVALMSGDKDGEKWGEEMVRWMRGGVGNHGRLGQKVV